MRQGADPDLMVQLPDGTHAALAMSPTDSAGVPAPREPPSPLLALDGRRQVAHLLAQLRQQGRFPSTRAPLQAARRDDTSYDKDN